MSTTLRLCSSLAFGAVCALGLNSCDPYYYQGGAAYGSDYYGGYGAGYGYGSPGFSTSFFVSTGDPYWGYDPYCHSYYDYRRRCYYDPYLYGYYPVGYRPSYVMGVPHPHGYRNNYCPPPARVSGVMLSSHQYQNRATAYRTTGHSWASNVRQQSYTPPRAGRDGTGGYQAQPNNRINSGGFQGGGSPQFQNSNRYNPPSSGGSIQPGGFNQGGGRNPGTLNSRPQTIAPSSGVPRSYNVPIDANASRQRQFDMRERRAKFDTPQPQLQQRPAPMAVPPPQNIQPQPPPSAPASPPAEAREVRGLGEGREAPRRR